MPKIKMYYDSQLDYDFAQECLRDTMDDDLDANGEYRDTVESMADLAQELETADPF